MDFTGIKSMTFDSKEMSMEEAFRNAVIEARASNKAGHFRLTEYQVVYTISMDTTAHPFGMYEAENAKRAAQEGEYDSVREAVEAWVEEAYSDERYEATAEASELLRNFCKRHPELTIEWYTGENECDSDENIDDEAREMGFDYPDYEELFTSCLECSYDGDGWDE